MSNGVIVINRQQAGEFLEVLESLEKTVAKLRSWLAIQFPSEYGSHSWWEKSDQKAIDSIRIGGGKSFDNAKEAVNYLHS